MKRKLIICRGIPGSGKSTWAKKFIKDNGSDKWIRINRDDIRNMLGEYWIPSREKLVDTIYQATFDNALVRGYNIILDNMNLNPVTVKEAVNKTMEFNTTNTRCLSYEIENKDFFISLEEAIERDSLRANPIGASTIKRIFKQYRYIFDESRSFRPIAEQDSSLPHAIIVDLDGTLALNTSGRPYYGEGCDEGYLNDSLNEPVANMVKQYNGTIIFVSGREGTELGIKNTKKWLKEHKLCEDDVLLIMRNKGDYRADDIVKKELYDASIKGKYYIDYVVDDRDKVVQMWRNEGLLCLQPWPGKF